MNSLRSWNAKGRWSLVGLFAAVGAFAGLASWALVWILALLLQFGRPSFMALVLAVPRGAIFGVVLALVLRVYLNRA